MATITIDPAYGYVLLSATSTLLMNFLHIINSGRHRKRAQVKYPAAYAPADRTDETANQFNCAQRAHANFIENQPSALAGMLLAGLRFPVTAAILGAAWTVFRYVYMVGYSRGGDGKGRLKGLGFWVCQVGLMGLAAWTGVGLVFGW